MDAVAMIGVGTVSVLAGDEVALWWVHDLVASCTVAKSWRGEVDFQLLSPRLTTSSQKNQELFHR